VLHVEDKFTALRILRLRSGSCRESDVLLPDGTSASRGGRSLFEAVRHLRKCGQMRAPVAHLSPWTPCQLAQAAQACLCTHSETLSEGTTTIASAFAREVAQTIFTVTLPSHMARRAFSSSRLRATSGCVSAGAAASSTLSSGLRMAIVSAKARLGWRSPGVKGDRVMGDVGLRASHCAIAARSYVLPSGSTTGSANTECLGPRSGSAPQDSKASWLTILPQAKPVMTSPEIGQRKLSGTPMSCNVSSPPAAAAAILDAFAEREQLQRRKFCQSLTFEVPKD